MTANTAAHEGGPISIAGPNQVSLTRICDAEVFGGRVAVAEGGFGLLRPGEAAVAENQSPALLESVSKMPASPRRVLNPLIAPAKVRGVPGLVLESIASEVKSARSKIPPGPSAVQCCPRSQT